MRKLVVNTFTTLDGVMQAPGGPEEDPTGGFEHGGWSAGYWDEAMGQWMGDFMGAPFDLLLGRKTYEIFAAHWPHAQDEPGAEQLNAATKYVASRTLNSVDWENSQLLEGDVADAIARLKEQEGPALQVHGSSNLIQTLLRHDLIDEFRVWSSRSFSPPGSGCSATGPSPAVSSSSTRRRRRRASCSSRTRLRESRGMGHSRWNSRPRRSSSGAAGFLTDVGSRFASASRRPV